MRVRADDAGRGGQGEYICAMRDPIAQVRIAESADSGEVGKRRREATLVGLQDATRQDPMQRCSQPFGRVLIR